MADILHQVEIASTPEKVFDALTTTEGLKGWWTVDANAKPEKNTVAVFGFYNQQVVFRMKIDEIIPNTVINWSCLGDDPEWTGTKISWILSKDGNSTRVIFSHTGWRTTEGYYRMCNTTWGHLMMLLKRYLEEGETNPFFKS